ncbi:sugar phosphate isomerase/epimerase [Burkholderia cenocepacia]|uniref:sugar phosphate isomerase/epimerase family protein n=1 Tax=Burkholderia cenocepacia TaxID=95486 RepID=UPI001B93879E|nr:sugar phosphate isomerase/epimerase family protein [Burkholderia cenocepacia]MBR8030091.1 sugar phosphate isomerase/epimerase [Burkholderia cenocepacia]MBR8174212.1 sugar phosphate isomerase/epimerase [Burkholderia cenocepacia]
MTQKNYGGSTFSYMWNSDAGSAMRELRNIGLNDFDALVLPGHLWHEELSAADRSDLVATLSQDDIRIESLNIPALDQNLASVVPEARRYAIDLYRQVLQLSADLRSKAVVVVPGRVSSLFPPPLSVSADLLRDSLENLLKTAEQLDQLLYLELHPQTPVNTAQKLADFLDEIPHPRLKVAYDVSNAEFVSEDHARALRTLAPRLGQLHLSDGTRTSWRHDRVGTGSVPFSEILATLDEIHFTGSRIIEVISTEAVKDIRASHNSLQRMQCEER